MVELMKINKNQYIVLNWLKAAVGTEGSLIRGIHVLYNFNLARDRTIALDKTGKLLSIRTALRQLTRQEEAEVLQMFSQWVLELGGK